MKGRKPKPTAIKELTGNPGKRALNKNEPKFAQITEIEPPVWMTDTAVTMWRTVMPELLATGVLTVADVHNVEAFCMSYSRWREAEQEVERYGLVIMDDNGKLNKNPALTIINEAKTQMMKFGSLLGLDPSSRTRLTGTANSEPIANPFADL
ncbi:terminase [Moraxella phage Mcat17]|uniref:phage terminase small subunit P27 family n=1 Tax=Moraxella catarrhalis TaxID=480 RepID=UPI000722FF6B|nr:phage terminase small subunit P27 family [Moraxella catarrhalis]AKI27719.1 terminase [Moraxella phage Mcat17]MPW64180.1 phage terminase small subunit P27 family [Moraxella catarrhalis]